MTESKTTSGVTGTETVPHQGKPKQLPKPKSRNYCLTFFTKPKHTLPRGVRYAIYGEERCKPTKEHPEGRIHWQSYIELYGSQRWNWIKKAWGDKTIHIQARKGTREQARDYCRKDGKFEEHGKWIKGQGHRTDLETIADGLVNGDITITDVMEQAPAKYCQYRNGLKDLAGLGAKKKANEFRKVEVVLLTGATGTGKTRRAMEEAQYRIQGTQLDWWQDYEGEKVICIDEYNNDVNITEMLNLLDGYRLRLNVKGSHTYALWDKVYITTNLKLHEIHANAKKAHRDALFRRITTIINLWPEESEWNEELQG